MLQDLPERDTVPAVRQTTGRILLYAVVAAVIVLLAVVSAPTRMVHETDADRWWQVYVLVTGAFGTAALLVIAPVYFVRARNLAHSLAVWHGLAKRLDDGAELFHTFLPTQKQVDRELNLRAMMLNHACRVKARFLGVHSDIFADSGVSTTGKRLILTSRGFQENQELERRLGELEATIVSAKEHFWDLHSRLWRHNKEAEKDRAGQAPVYKLLGSWKAYLPGATPASPTPPEPDHEMLAPSPGPHLAD